MSILKPIISPCKRLLNAAKIEEVTKYKEYVGKMLEANKSAFESFRKIHDQYTLDEEKYQEEFNQEGEKILPLIHDWEDRLCRQSEKAGYAGFTGGLAEKFQAEVKREFPLIDHVGLIVDRFSIKKINLNN